MKARRFAALSLLLLLASSLPLPLLAQTVNRPLPAPFVQPTSAPLLSLAPGNPTIQRIRNRGNLMIAGVLFDYEPFAYLNDQGEITGFEVELLRAIANAWSIDVQFVPVTPSTRVQSLVAGQVDLVMAAMPHAYAADALIDFSQSYFVDTPALLVRSAGPTTALTALAGKTIATIQSDVATAQLQAALTSAAVAATIMPFQEYSPALLALKAGQADALLADSTYLTQVSRALPMATQLLPLPERQSFAIGLTQGDAYFRNLLDATLTGLQQSGVFDTLYTQWFPALPVPLLEQLPGAWPYTFANTPSELALPSISRLLQLQTRGKLLVGVPYDFAPFGFLDNQGQLQGFDIDLSRELARRWLGNADAVELVRVTPETAIPLLMAGQVDLIAAALPLTWSNRAAIDFSQHYFLDSQSVLTRADSAIQTLADLDQKVVAVIGGRGGVNDLVTLTNPTALGVTITPTFLPFQELYAAQQALLAGQVEAVIGSSVALSQTAQTNPSLKITVAHFGYQPYAIGIPQFDAQLRDQVNLTLQAMQADGVYSTFYQHWFATTPTSLDQSVTMPASPTVASNDTANAPVAVATQGSQSVALLMAAATQLPALSLSAMGTVSASILSTLSSGLNSVAEASATPTAEKSTAANLGNTRPTTTATPTPAPTVLRVAPTQTLPVTVVPPRQSLILRPTTTPTALPNVTMTAALTDTLPLLRATDTVQASLPVPTISGVAATTVTMNSGMAATTVTMNSGMAATTVTIRPGINVNVRREPTATSPILEVLVGGTSWPFVALSADGEWIEVQLAGRLRGWVATALVEQDPVTAPIAPTTAPMTDTPNVAPALVSAPPAPVTHRVNAADTLATIAKQYYGNQGLWQLIYDANRELIGEDPNAIPIGAELVIPPLP